MNEIEIKPRKYQQKIFETTIENNTLVVLPTGLGKTLIALMLTVERLKKFPAKKTLFLAPTRPLVEQHLKTYKSILPELYADLQIFTGEINSGKRKKIFQTADVIFSTPQCISNDLKAGLYSLEDVSLVIIDEAHRCLKNYSYTSVVDYYKRQSPNQRILGLTASPGHEEEKIREICRHLDIEKIEIRSRDSEDVKPFIQEVEYQKIEVEFPKEFIEIRVLLKRLFDSCINQLKSRNLLFGPANKITLLKLQNNLFKKIQSKDFNAIAGVSLTAQAIKISHAIELLETQTLSGLDEYLKSLINQAKESKSKAVQILVKKPEFNAAIISLQNLITKKIEHPKLEKILDLIDKEIKENNKSKIIIFSQFRETVHALSEKLNQIEGIKSAIFIGQAKKITSKGIFGLNQKEQKETIDKFRVGEINVICATSIAEEGLDIPEVSSVIFYEPIPSAIRKIQRAGRTARLKPGKIAILITQDTRDVTNHYASTAREKKMKKTIENVQKELSVRNKKLTNFYK